MKLSAFRPLRNSMKEEDLLGYDEDVLDRLTWNNLAGASGRSSARPPKSGNKRFSSGVSSSERSDLFLLRPKGSQLWYHQAISLPKLSYLTVLSHTFCV
jgi:hypothetical protein